MATGFVAGGIATGSLKGALVGAFTAGAFHGVGTHFQGLGKLTSGLKAAKALAHGVVGGISSVLNGGKFGHGFASAGISQAMGGTIDGISDKAGRIVASAVVGGTVSEITGGKFANGAVTGAFSRAFNEEVHPKSNRPTFSSNDERLSGLVKSANEHSVNGNYDGLLPEGADGNISLTVDPTVKAKMSPLSLNVIGINPDMLSDSLGVQTWALGHELSHIGDLYTMYSTPNKSALMGPVELKASEIKAYNWSHNNVNNFISGFRNQINFKQQTMSQISCYRNSGAACGH
jgi:hypothetical protein